jgi:Bifunctional DNA primase/polymerase, N-terminal/Primase C terminal 1 (PriCT-1)
MTLDLLAAATDYAKRQWPVFPLHYIVTRQGRLVCTCGNPQCKSERKHPYARCAPHGHKDATTNIAAIERWWGAGVPYNIGLKTGAESGFFVLDVDPRHNGDRTLSEVEQRFGPLPITPRFMTGGGGDHHLFRHPGFVIPTKAGIGDGLDIRGDGGYIAAPPSLHVSGRRYAVSVDHHPDDIGIAPAPTWLLELLRPVSTPRGTPTMAATPERWRKLVAEGVAEGRRNDAVARLAGHLLRPGPKNPYLVLDLLRCWNAQRCHPPLAETELARTVKSICDRELARQEEAANA